MTAKLLRDLSQIFVDEMDNDEQDEITILIDGSSPDEPTEVSLYESDIIRIRDLK